MTSEEYAALPAFTREWPKATIEAQYRDNAAQLSAMAERAAASGLKKINGFTIDQLRERAARFAELGRAR